MTEWFPFLLLFLVVNGFFSLISRDTLRWAVIRLCIAVPFAALLVLAILAVERN